MKKRFLAMVLAVLVTANTISVPEVKAVENSNSESVENVVSEDAAEEIQNEETEEVEDDLSTEEVVTQETAEEEQAEISLESADEEVATYTVTIENEKDLVYNGKAQTPVVKVTDTNGNVVDSDNYDVTYTAFVGGDYVEYTELIDAAEYNCTITSNNNATEKFTGSVYFLVSPFNLINTTIDSEHESYVYSYTGEEVSIKDDIKKYLMEHYDVLSNPEDFTVKPIDWDGKDYDEFVPVNPGVYHLVCYIESTKNNPSIIGKNHFDYIYVTVNEAPVKLSKENLDIHINDAELVYNGMEQKAPKVSVFFMDENQIWQRMPEDQYSVSAETGTIPGTYKISVTSKENGKYVWDGSAEVTYEIVPFELSRKIPGYGSNYEDDYTGGLIDLAQAVRNNLSYIPGDYHLTFQTEDGQEVDETDLQIVDAGDYKYTCIVTPGDDPYITGQQKFSVKLTVNPLDISKISKTDVYVENISDVIYTGEKIDPSECYEAGYVQNGEKIPFDKDDYTLTFSNKKMINAGTYQGTFTVKANSDGNLKGSFTCKGAVTVAPKEIPADQVSVVLTKEYQFYNGKMQNAPGVKAVYYEIPTEDPWDDSDLVKLSTKDYEVVKGSKASEVGEHEVYVTAKKGGNYTWEGTAVGTYDIYKNAANFVVEVSEVKYLGDAPQIVVYEDKAAASAKADPLVEYEDYYVEPDTSKPGKETFIIKGIEGISKYAGSKKVTVAVEKYSLEDALENGNINIDIYGDTSYTGSAVKPELRISVKSEGQTSQWITLFDKQDYTVTYSNNVKVGSEATATIKGKGNITGTIKTTFEIKPIDLEQAGVIAEIKPVKVSNKAWKPSAVLKYVRDNKALKLKAGKDYDIRLSENADMGVPGYYDVIITAKDETTCVGTIYGTLHVYKQLASSLVVVVNDGNKVVYDGTDKSKDPDFVKVYANAADAKKKQNALTPVTWDEESGSYVDGDYQIYFDGDTTNAGTATIVIEGINDYEGQKKVKFKISK